MPDPVIGPAIYGIHGEAAFLDVRTDRDDDTRRAAGKIFNSRTRYRRKIPGTYRRGHATCIPGQCLFCDTSETNQGAHR